MSEAIKEPPINQSIITPEKKQDKSLSSNKTILRVHKLSKYYPVLGGLLKREVAQIKALQNISFTLEKNKVLSLVGESGCGKTTAGRTITQLYPKSSGHIVFNKPQEVFDELDALSNRIEDTQDEEVKENLTRELEALYETHDLSALNARELNRERLKIQMMFQDPYGTLNPRFQVKQIISEGLDIHKLYPNTKEKYDYVAELLTKVGLDPSNMNRYPHEFSGGQRQRIGLARALALNPMLLVLDEPVSALDVSVQVQVIDLLNEVKDTLKLSYIFIAHDLSVVEYFTDDVAVMYLGHMVEIGTKKDIFDNRLHPYTQSLINAIPLPEPSAERRFKKLDGEPPSPSNPPSGCPFHTRCPKAMDVCRQKMPPLKLAHNNRHTHKVACWLYD